MVAMESLVLLSVIVAVVVLPRGTLLGLKTFVTVCGEVKTMLAVSAPALLPTEEVMAPGGMVLVRVLLSGTPLRPKTCTVIEQLPLAGTVPPASEKLWV